MEKTKGVNRYEMVISYSNKTKDPRFTKMFFIKNYAPQKWNGKCVS